jgi:hypothetical protein
MRTENGKPTNPSVSIFILLAVPLAIVTNLVIAAILFAIKRQFAKAFLINSILAGIIMYYLFIAGVDRHQRIRYEGWKFNISDTTFIVTHSKLDNRFWIEYSLKPGGSTSFIDGKFTDNKSNYSLTTDSTKYTIKNDFLFGFRGKDSFKLAVVKY